MTNDKTVSEIIGETAANRDRAIAEAEAKRRAMWARIPRLAELDGVLSRTGSRIMAAAAAGGDVAARVAEIERETERLHAERGQRPHDLFVAAHFRSQHEEQQPDDERDDAAERTERSAAQQAAREDAAEEDSEQNQHRQCGILRAKIGKKADGRKLCACGRRNEVRR